MRDDEEVERLMKEYEEAVADEQDAASRAAAVADELRDAHGIDVQEDGADAREDDR